MGKTFVFKICLGIVVFLSITFFILFSIFNGLLQDFLYDQLKDQLNKEAKDISRIILSKGVEDVNSVIETATEHFNGSIIVTDSLGNIIGKSSSAKFKGEVEYNYNLFLEALNYSKVEVMKDNSLTMGVPIIGDIPAKYREKTKWMNLEKFNIDYRDKVVATVFITVETNKINVFLDSMGTKFLWIALLITVIWILLIHYLTKNFSEYLYNMNKVTMDLTSGKYSETLDIKEKGELGHLAKNINNLSQRLYAVERIRKDFIANISHEFRTPLGVIRGYTEAIIDGLARNKEEEDKYLDIILSEIERMQHLVSDLLDLSQIDAGLLKINKQAISIDNLIIHVIDVMDPLLEEKNIKLYYQNQDPNLIVWVDEYRIYQVFINIINNSIKYTPKEGKIYIGVFKDQSRLKVCIKDTGKGIFKKDLPFIWERFYKGDRSRSENKKNLGIGLSIVKNILDAHKSDVSIHSEVGMGTEICFTLSIYEN